MKGRQTETEADSVHIKNKESKKERKKESDWKWQQEGGKQMMRKNLFGISKLSGSFSPLKMFFLKTKTLGEHDF